MTTTPDARSLLAALVEAEDAGIAVWQAVKDCGHPVGDWCAEMQHVADTSDARDAATKAAYEQARAFLAAAPASGLREALAALEHEQWVAWSRNISDTEPGLSSTRQDRWSQAWVPYADLPEDLKEKDREWADKVLAALAAPAAPDVEKVTA